MPRPAIDLEPYRSYIIELSEQKTTVKDIIRLLQQQHNITVSERTIRSRMSEWNHKTYQHTDDSSELRLRITNLFINCCLKDDDILEVLRHEDFEIGEQRLVRIRKELGLLRRISTIEEGQAADVQLRQIVRDELEKGTIQGFGRGYLYTHFRGLGHIASR